MEKETSKKTHKKAKKEEKVKKSKKRAIFQVFINKVVSKNLILELTFEE